MCSLLSRLHCLHHMAWLCGYTCPSHGCIISVLPPFGVYCFGFVRLRVCFSMATPLGGPEDCDTPRCLGGWAGRWSREGCPWVAFPPGHGGCLSRWSSLGLFRPLSRGCFGVYTPWLCSLPPPLVLPRGIGVAWGDLAHCVLVQVEPHLVCCNQRTHACRHVEW